jgi:thioredoxin reductase (NADPH)
MWAIAPWRLSASRTGAKTVNSPPTRAFVKVPGMTYPHSSILETRRDQILPRMDATDIERARRFGEVRHFATGEALAKIGEVGVGLGIILSGQVDVYRYDAYGDRQHFYAFGSGSFLG